MKRSGQLLALILTVSVTSLPTVAATVPKVGAACPKVGATQIVKSTTYTCAKSGQRNVWRKVSKTNKKNEAAAPSAKPSLSGDPREATYSHIRSIAASRQSLKPQVEVTYIVNPVLKTAKVQEVKDRFAKAVRFFSQELNGKKFIVVMSNTENMEWARVELQRLSPQPNEWRNYAELFTSNPQNRCRLWGAGNLGTSGGGEFLQSYIFPPDECTNENTLPVVWKTSVEHEIVGSVQEIWASGQPFLLPCWLVEGQQVYYGSALGTSMNFTEFSETFAWHRRFKRDDLMTGAKKLGNVQGLDCGQAGGYEVGRLLVEQLLYEFGHEALVTFTKSIPTINGMDPDKWSIAFSTIFKVSFDEWLIKVVPIIEERERS